VGDFDGDQSDIIIYLGSANFFTKVSYPKYSAPILIFSPSKFLPPAMGPFAIKITLKDSSNKYPKSRQRTIFVQFSSHVDCHNIETPANET
jgi:hypothetical protein